MKNIFLKNKIGFTLVEVLIACAIISTVILAVMAVAEKGLKLSSLALKQAQANFLLEEGAEVVKSIRDNGWTNISNLNLNTNYYIYYDTNNNIWTINTSSSTPTGFTPSNPIDDVFIRTITFSSVYRDGNDDISSSGTLDQNARKVTLNISWQNHGINYSKDLNFYIFNIFE